MNINIIFYKKKDINNIPLIINTYVSHVKKKTPIIIVQTDKKICGSIIKDTVDDG